MTTDSTAPLLVLEMAQAVLLHDEPRMAAALDQVQDWHELALAAVSLVGSNMISVAGMTPEAAVDYLNGMAYVITVGGW